MTARATTLHARPPARHLLHALTLALTLAGGMAGCTQRTPPSAAPASTDVAVARGRIDIEGGLLNLSMSRDGTLAQVAVHEGDHVKAGQLLAALDPEPAQFTQNAARAEHAQAQAQWQLAGARLDAARQRAQRLRAAHAAGAGDGQSADDARAQVIELTAERTAAKASLDLAQQKLAQARYELGLRQLHAPVTGDIIHVSAQVGASVGPGTATLFTLLPERPRIVRAELNESFAAAIHPGTLARVTLSSGDDAHALAAHVLRVAPVYGPSTLENDPQIRANARTVECVLAFDQPQDLRIGQRVLVRFARDGAPSPGR